MNSLKLNISLLLIFLMSNTCFAQVSLTYEYNKAGWLTKTVYSNGIQVLYTYDNNGNRLSKIIVTPCVLADLVVSNIFITKYTPDKIYYTLRIKNQGSRAVSLNSVSFAAFNAPNSVRDGNEEFKSSAYIGGTLNPNDIIDINYSSAFNFATNKYYLIITADYGNNLAECIETNNDLAKLVNPCTSNTDYTVTGTQANKLIATNGTLTISGVSANNVLFLGRSVAISPSPSSNLQNSAVAIGGCLNIPAGARIAETNQNATQTNISNLQFANGNFSFDSSEPLTLSLEVYGDTERKLLDIHFENNSFETGHHVISLDTSKWVKGQKYSIHLKDNVSIEVLIVAW